MISLSALNELSEMGNDQYQFASTKSEDLFFSIHEFITCPRCFSAQQPEDVGDLNGN
jgi:hypothetical protein